MVSLFRLYVLRATYLLLVVGLGLMIWPQIIDHPMANHGATTSLLAGVQLLAIVGLRYPLQMLPLLLFELVWKSIWLMAIALPLWLAHQMDADVWDSVNACLWGIVIMPIAIPWPYVFAHYLKKPGDRWLPAGRAGAESFHSNSITARGV
jgi:hypothetical protein